MKPSEKDSNPPFLLPDLSGKDTATLELLDRWRREDITGDSAAIAKAEAEVNQFIENMNRNRVEAGESPTF